MTPQKLIVALRKTRQEQGSSERPEVAGNNERLEVAGSNERPEVAVANNEEAVAEDVALTELFRAVRKEIREQGCNRAILVGHNAHFDAGLINAAVERCGIKRNPFHPFSIFDTVTLAGAALGQTVLARAAVRAGLGWDPEQAHSATYDAEQTADLFCLIVNGMRDAFPL